MNDTFANTPGNARHVIVGLGRTGLSCARYFSSRGERFAITDSRENPPGLNQVSEIKGNAIIRTGEFDYALLDEADVIILSPGVSMREPFLKEAQKRRIPIVGDIELFARAVKAPVVGITGTNGKSTVTTLVARMAEACGRRVLAGGNLGKPALDLLIEPTPDLYVLELSSFQLETTYSLRCAAAAVLNITPDHMDRYDDIEEYAAAKARILDGCMTAVVNWDDPYTRNMPLSGQRTLAFSLDADATAPYRARKAFGELLLLRGEETLVKMRDLRITGAHNAANALAALAICDALGLDAGRCIDALKSFEGLPHRAQWVADVAGVRYIDDSKGTNVGATLAAVSGMDAPLVLIAGGMGKGQDFAPLAEGFAGKVRHVVLIGQDAGQIETVLHGVCSTERAVDMQSAVKRAAAAARDGDTVLLSPASASLDMFRDYAHRGDEFAAAVRRLA
jgi:UDP-N-acetylmuramoylalanine--D-glutamate ligase